MAESVLNLAQYADAVAAGDQEVAGRSGLDADRLAGTNPIVPTALDAVQPEHGIAGHASKSGPPRRRRHPGKPLSAKRDWAVRGGTAVAPSRLAPYAVSLARRYQVVPRRGSATWLIRFAEVGRLGLLPVFLILIVVDDRWGTFAGIAAALVTLVLLAPLSRRMGAARRRRAQDAEIANTKLLDESAES